MDLLFCMQSNLIFLASLFSPQLFFPFLQILFIYFAKYSVFLNSNQTSPLWLAAFQLVAESEAVDEAVPAASCSIPEAEEKVEEKE